MTGVLSPISILPWHRRRIERAAKADAATQEVVETAGTLRRQADDVIRAAYELADARMRERQGRG